MPLPPIPEGFELQQNNDLPPMPEGFTSAEQPIRAEVAPQQQGIFNTIAPHFMEGVKRTIEGVPRVARNVAGGMVSGLADIGRTVASIPSPLELIGVVPSAPEPKIFNRVTALGEDIAFDKNSAEFGVGQFIAPTPPMGRAGKVVKTAYGKAIDSLPFDAKRRAESALNKLDSIGAKDLSVKTRGALMDELNLPTKEIDEVAINQKIQQSLDIAEQNLHKEVTDLYTEANKIGSQTKAVDIRNIINEVTKKSDGTPDILLQRKLAKGVDEDATKAKANIDALLDDATPNNASDIEDIIKSFKTDQRSAGGMGKELYGRAIRELEKTQQSLLAEAGHPELFKTARDRWQTYQKEFKGNLEGYGTTGGKSIESVNKARDNFDISEKLLGGTLDKNLAEQVGKNFTAQERRDMVFSMLAKGLDDVGGLNTDVNAIKFINNFEKMDKRGLKAMLGEDGYRKAKESVDALSFVESAIKVADKQSADISQDILEMGAALAAMKISPYAATHVAINKSKNILTKKGFLKMKTDLIARTKEIQDTRTKNVLLNAIGKLQPVSVGYQEIANKENEK